MGREPRDRAENRRRTERRMGTTPRRRRNLARTTLIQRHDAAVRNPHGQATFGPNPKGYKSPIGIIIPMPVEEASVEMRALILSYVVWPGEIPDIEALRRHPRYVI